MSTPEALDNERMRAAIMDMTRELDARDDRIQRLVSQQANADIEHATLTAIEQIDTVVRMAASIGSVGGSSESRSRAIDEAVEVACNIINCLADSVIVAERGES